MKVAFVTSGLSSAGGGVATVVEALSRAVADRGVDVTVLSLQDANWSRDRAAWRGANAEVFPVVGPRSLGMSPALRRALVGLDPDVVHVHGLWTHVSADVVTWSRGRKPYIVSSHGMLDPWAVANSGYKKRIARWLYEDRHLHGATRLHALCDAEADAIRAFGLTNAICVIPNGVDLPTPGPRPLPPWEGGHQSGKRVLLFLGRLHPKKNLHGLLRGLAGVERAGGLADWRLVVAGWDQGSYGNEMIALSRELGLEQYVEFLGPVHGARKDAALRNATAFVLPSVSEGLPMAVLEAWAYGLPVAITAACNLPEGYAARAAHEIRENPEDMTRDLDVFLSTVEADMRAMGARGRDLVSQRFSWPRVANSLCEVYSAVTQSP